MLTLWMDKVLEERENVQETFESLRFYIDNFKPITEIKPEHRDKMLRFLNQAYECHLKVKSDKERSEEEAEEETGVCISFTNSNLKYKNNVQTSFAFVWVANL